MGFHVAEATFNRLSMPERSKLDGEATINVAGRQRSHEDAGQHSSVSEYIAVNLFVASRSPIKLLKLITTEDLRNGPVSVGLHSIWRSLSLEVIWLPDGSEDMLTATDLITLYLKLQAL